MQAVVIHVDGGIDTFEFDKRLTLEQLQKLVGGYIQSVKCRWTGRARSMVVNEEGKLLGMAPNIIATHCYRAAFPKGVCTDWIAGDAVVLIGMRV